MTTTRPGDRASRASSQRGVRVARRRWTASQRRFLDSEYAALAGLAVLCVVLALPMLKWEAVPLSALLVPLVLGSLLLGPKRLPWFVIGVLAVLVVVAALSRQWMTPQRASAIGVLFLVGLIILLASFRRSRLGVAGVLGESMFVDLRDRIGKQAQLPVLPSDWYAEAVLRSAGGTSFAGDFVVAARPRSGSSLEIAVVDVSGKGVQAGTRSLLLSGAFGGLLGALPAAGFLPAANDYLLDQDWPEGFATAVHLSLDLDSGDFELRSAGHPPAVQLHAGSGRWEVHEVEGPVLGLLPDAHFASAVGRLERGDALLLFTDGLVETRSRDISLGIDRLVGESERLLRGGFDRGADRLIDRVGATNDDRALLLLHRR